MSITPMFVSASATAKVLGWQDMINAIRSAYAVQHAPLTSFRALARGEGVWLRSLVSIPPGSAYMGAKTFGRTQKRQVTYLVSLFDQQTSELVALVDGRHLTALRTAATSAVATDMLVSSENVRVGVLGSGSEAHAHVQAVGVIRKISQLRVFSPTPDRRAQFAAGFEAELGCDCRPVGTAQEVFEGADIVIAAARSRDETPILNGDWLNKGCLLISIGSTIPEQRELDLRSIERCDLIVCDMVDEVEHQTGDFLAAKAKGVPFKDKLVSLNDLVMNKIDARVRQSVFPMYKSVGAAVQDISIAELVFRRARDRGLATPLGESLEIQHV